ncbi:uncharacterized protein LOC108711638 [Xenopus laevis]|uniref:Uncharacterized protein LOC108711638 n=2 Tax=Xenopus laevis TaxID=8355 RepID=A0A1L8H281_XENLA|nr:uncharacterized protein LOC108711638 [Xenopus laevis]XP_018109053.1 uncharacterized protein LOC108711638 [Xenopus laevis]XP_018109054.1 uncharacterized protein LOC108711638 [Xenopus laevis]XP_018109055.1 uncharacterized protein LOC108711638 [Xenopus laevis]XP_018109056.1 uncharacterized protein LOC108711638 [Xenopus laevis]XP_018109057.1 uncharacterized protein LOC108711638 [Xenopus laevis]XP_041443038.1 uncharacterized protein LOC108711638 [Xenopus laevis]OCT90199.1 hypothetical protein 
METDDGSSKLINEVEGNPTVQQETPICCLQQIADNKEEKCICGKISCPAKHPCFFAWSSDGSPPNKQSCTSDKESETECNTSDTSSEPGRPGFRCFDEEDDWVGNCELPSNMTAFNQETEDWDAEMEQSEDNYDKKDLADHVSAHSFSVPDCEWQGDTSYNPSVHHASLVSWNVVSRQPMDGQFDDAEPQDKRMTPNSRRIV